MTNRKHHCRKCGGTFCQLCSSNETVLLEMGINEPVRVCDSCYKNPPEKDKRKAQLIERRPFEETDDPELKRAIELSLKEQQGHRNTFTETKFDKGNEDEEALKKAIEASLKEVGPTHLQNIQNQATSIEKRPKVKYFSDLEVENVDLFHQLIGRLVKMRPVMNTEDVEELKKLAAEMRCLLKRPIESEDLKNKLVESLHGFDSIFSGLPSSPSVQQRFGSVASSSDLSQMKNEILDKSPEPVSLVRTKLGSMSLENTAVDSHSNNEIIPNSPNTQHYVNAMPAQIPSISPFQNQHRHSVNGPIGFHSPFIHPQSQFIYPPNYHHNIVRPPMQLCPDMTIHPHPIHPPMAHANPYAKKAVEMKEKRSSKESKSKKTKKDEKGKSDSKKRKHKKKEKKKEESESEKKKSKSREKIKLKDDEKQKKRGKEIDQKDSDTVKERGKRKKIEEDRSKHKKTFEKKSEIIDDDHDEKAIKVSGKKTKVDKSKKPSGSKSGKKRMKSDAETQKDDKSDEKRMKNDAKESEVKKEPPNLIDL